MARTRRNATAIRPNTATQSHVLTMKVNESECARFSCLNNVLSDGLRLSQEVELLKKQNSALLQELDELRALG